MTSCGNSIRSRVSGRRPKSSMPLCTSRARPSCRVKCCTSMGERMPADGEAGPTVRLRELGVVLPEPPRPLGHYVAAVQSGSLLVLSGMLPLQHGAPATVGRVGDRVSLDEGRAAARLAALNALAAASAALGSLDRIRRVVRATVSI